MVYLHQLTRLQRTVLSCLILTAGAAFPIDIHDPEIIRQDDMYYIFSTGRRGMVLQTLRSTDLRTWQRIDPVLPAVPEWVRKEIPQCRGFWAPGVHLINGRYCLY